MQRLFALPINVHVLQLILRGQPGRIASDFIPLNQIVCELILSLVSIWHFLPTVLSICVFWRMFLFASSSFLIARPLVQSYRCVEHYLATIHPVTFIRCKPLRYRLICGCVSWLGVVVFDIFGCIFDFKSEFFAMI